MTVAVFAAFKAAQMPWVVNLLLSPLYQMFVEVTGSSQVTPWEELPEWYQKLPASRLKGSEGLNKV